LTVLAAIFTLGTAFLGYQTTKVTQAKEQAQAVAANKNTDLVPARPVRPTEESER